MKWNSTSFRWICQACEIEAVMSFVIWEVIPEASKLFLNRGTSEESVDGMRMSLKCFYIQIILIRLAKLQKHLQGLEQWDLVARTWKEKEKGWVPTQLLSLTCRR